MRKTICLLICLFLAISVAQAEINWEDWQDIGNETWLRAGTDSSEPNAIFTQYANAKNIESIVAEAYEKMVISNKNGIETQITARYNIENTLISNYTQISKNGQIIESSYTEYLPSGEIALTSVSAFDENGMMLSLLNNNYDETGLLTNTSITYYTPSGDISEIWLGTLNHMGNNGYVTQKEVFNANDERLSLSFRTYDNEGKLIKYEELNKVTHEREEKPLPKDEDWVISEWERGKGN